MSIGGRAKILVPAFVAAASAAVVAALLVRRGEREPAIAAPATESVAPSSPDASSPKAGDARDASSTARAPVVQGRVEPPAPASAPTSTHPGVIRGEVLAATGVTFPERWTLHVGPHPWLAGHETATDRRIEFEHGETTFELRDLPLGGYLVEAIAPGLNCLPGNLMLVEGSEDQFVTIELTPTGTIDGGVLDSAGRPAEGLDVTLESVATRERRTQPTDPAGNFVFREVKDGEYRMLFGRPDTPLLPPQSLVFQAPSMQFPTKTLPPTAGLELKVVDVRLRPVAGARISGTASEGGAIDTRSDTNGVARLRYLPPGSYRVDARGEHGLRASTVIALVENQEASIRIILRDPNERRE